MDASEGRLPEFDELPVQAGAPPGSSWGLWGDGDANGCLNLLTPQRVRAGLAAAIDGQVFNLNLELDLPDPPLFGRKGLRHTVLDSTTVSRFASSSMAWTTARTYVISAGSHEADASVVAERTTESPIAR